MPDWFEQSEFSGGGGELSPSEHFESMHSPALGYTYIRKSLASLDAGLEEFEERERKEAEIYANVTVFREVMQYIEEFGIYLYSRLDPSVDFVEAMTGTTPRQVKEIFESIRDGEFDEILDEYQDGMTGDEWLKTQLGYDKLGDQSGEVSLDDLVDGEPELNVETVDEAITESIQTVRTHLREIAEFFLRFEEPYNAIKHGNRVHPLIDHELKLEGPDGDIEVEVDEDYVSFLCKTTGDRRGGERYTFTAPVRILREQGVAVVELAKNLYTQMYDIKQKVEESRRTGEEVTLNPNFYGVTESDEGGPRFSLQNIQNPDAAVWIPEEALSEEIDEYELPIRNEVAIGVRRQGNEMVVETEGNRTPSYDYPLLAEAELQSDSDRLLGMRITQGFSFRLYQLPLWQYLEFQSLSEIGPIHDVTLEYVNSGESDTRHTDQPVSLPSLPDPDFPEILEFMRNVGRAADAEIWVPYYWPPRVLQVIEFYRQEYELTRDIAEDLLEDIAELTAEEVATVPTISILNPNGVNEEGDYEAIEHEELRLMRGGIILDIHEDRGEAEFSNVSGSDSRYERDEVGHLEAVGVTLVEDTPERAYETFREHGLEAVTRLSYTDNLEEAGAVLETKRIYGPKFTWYYLDKFHFAFYEEIPPHLDEMLS